jgi:hypothetical protein
MAFDPSSHNPVAGNFAFDSTNHRLVFYVGGE